MSFVKNIFSKMSGGASSVEGPDEPDDEEDFSETSTEASDDTGVFSPDSFSPANSNSDLETNISRTRLDSTARLESIPSFDQTSLEGINIENVVEADCSTISNFFGYWYVIFYFFFKLTNRYCVLE